MTTPEIVLAAIAAIAVGLWGCAMVGWREAIGGWQRALDEWGAADERVAKLRALLLDVTNPHGGEAA